MPAHVIRANFTPQNWSSVEGKVNDSKRQKPKKITKAKKQALQIAIRKNRRNRI